MRDPENRRIRLQEWLATATIPQGEKSFISQLINGKAPFGEKAATRLEKLLGMPDGYLDQTPGTKTLDQETAALVDIMARTDNEGRIRARIAATDAIKQYEMLRVTPLQSASLGKIPAELISRLVSQQDDDFIKELEAFVRVREQSDIVNKRNRI